jgi:shikimate dehydrogenase
VLSSVKKLISNKIIKNNFYKNYSLIIGKNPSRGARSPLLWNAAYKKHGIKAKMYPADVSKKNIKKLIKALYLDKNFLAAVVTNPYKEIVYRMLKKNSSILAKRIGAINCIYRKQNDFYTTNTDAEASFLAIKNKISLKKKNVILILGFGGVGKAVMMAFKTFLKNSKIYVVTRKNNNKYQGINFIKQDQLNAIFKDITICINCTVLGSKIKKKRSPLNLKQIKKLKKTTLIFDVIYNPRLTLFLKLSKKIKLQITNGIQMNLLQAVLAFNLANKFSKNNSKTFLAMRDAK